jgi:cytochrome P450
MHVEVGYQRPSIRRHISFGLLTKFLTQPHAAMLQLAQEQGPIATLKVGKRVYTLLSDPEDIREIIVVNTAQFRRADGARQFQQFTDHSLLNVNGAEHLQQRRQLQPAFHQHLIDGFATTMIAFAQQTGQRWHDQMTVDMNEEMICMTISIIAKRLFDAILTKEQCLTLMNTMALFSNIDVIPLGAWADDIPTPANVRRKKAGAALNDFVYGMIDEHRLNPTPPDDLLTMLLQIRDAEGKPLRDSLIRDEMIALLFAGHDTTGNALAWAWYLLSQNPVVEAKLHAELDDVLGGRLPTVADLPRLTYLHGVFAEAMRLYPPAWSFGRIPLADYSLHGHTLPANSTVICSPYVVHHDPRWYPDPFICNPDRWEPEARAARPKLSYIPFSSGPHRCLGEQFSWMEGKMVLATLAQHWQARLVPGHAMRVKPGVTLRPRDGTRMVLSRREPAHGQDRFAFAAHVPHDEHVAVAAGQNP